MDIALKPYALTKSMITSLQHKLSAYCEKVDPKLRVYAGELYCVLAKLLSRYQKCQCTSEAGIVYQLNAANEEYQISLNVIRINMSYLNGQKDRILYEFTYQIGLHLVELTSIQPEYTRVRTNMNEVTIQFVYPIYRTEEQHITAMQNMIDTSVKKIDGMLQVQDTLMNCTDAIITVPYYQQEENPYVN